MALVMLALNGKGLGHLTRISIVSQALGSLGERPVIFSEGNYNLRGLTQFPARRIPSLWASPEVIRRQVSDDLSAEALTSLPAMVVEDTHPNPIQLPDSIRRVLLVRPTSFSYLVNLNRRHASTYAAFLLCDSSGSPSWPYDEAQTAQVQSWRGWHGVGPVYRTPSEDDIREVRERYRITEDQPICVFSMGGGGVDPSDTKGQDIVKFLKIAFEVAAVVKPSGSQARLLFVKGPYFPRRIPVPPQFEVIPDEEQMPALLKLARGAVIRAGFNTAWECAAGGTPFIPLTGTTYAEPVQERIAGFASMGLIAASAEQLWYDEAWRERHRRAAASVASRFPGTPDPARLQNLIWGSDPQHG